MTKVTFDVKLVPAGTGSAVWDDPNARGLLDRFMPAVRDHGPMIGILHLGELRPTPGVLTDVIVRTGEEIRAGRYGEFSFVVSSQDDPTRSIISYIAAANNLAVFLARSPDDLKSSEPVGSLTESDQETLRLVLRVGGTVTAASFAGRIGVEQTTAGNRLATLHRKGYLQRVKRPHPAGDQFIDPRSLWTPRSK